ncbi:MAG: hypothetical protein OXG02_09000 [Chloroflexi bacterium]|nr:hypothetical protein [Chloroflexota bacterium]
MPAAEEVQFRLLKEMRDLEALVQLELAIWQLPPLDAAPSALMVAFIHNGGLVIGGYHEDRLVALALAFVGRKGERIRLWSHMAGVHPDFRGRGIGQGIKWAQREFALAAGFTQIAWTYDPLLRGNANFNLRLLAATAQVYHVNHYGEMQDAINVGLPSDRLEVQWDLRDERVQALAAGQDVPRHERPAPFLLEKDGHGAPLANAGVLSEAPAQCRIEIPRDVDQMRQDHPDRALAWRLALREAMRSAFAAGYRAQDFVHYEDRCWYVLEQGGVHAGGGSAD